MSDLLIRGGRLIDPALSRDEIADVLVADGRVRAVGSDLAVDEGTETVDAGGLIVAPGFVDLHCHLRQPGQEHKETIASGTAAAIRGGFTTVCAMPNTSPAIDNGGLVEAMLRTAATEGVARVLPIGAITRGSEGHELADLGEMAAAGAVAFSDDGRPVDDAAIMRRALEYSLILDLPVVDHCQDSRLSAGAVMHEGWVAARLGLQGAPAAAEEAAVARDLQLAELSGAHIHIAHVSTAGSVELVRRAKDRGINVTAEVTPHHLTLNHELVMGGAEAAGESLAYDSNAKVNPPLRAPEDVAACVAGLREGVIDCIATDHAPHAEEDKLCEFGGAAFGISGLETAFALCNRLVVEGELDLPTLIKRLTVDPVRAFGLDRAQPGLGTLREGAPGDIVLIDPAERWVVDPAAFVSKGKNTPLGGHSRTGRVKATIYSGRLAWSELREGALV